MPCVLVTGCLGLYSCVAVVDGEVQGDHAVAAQDVLFDKYRSVGGGGVGDVVPCILVTGRLGLHSRVTAVDGEVQGIHIVAR